jgi:hypothetical protein
VVNLTEMNGMVVWTAVILQPLNAPKDMSIVLLMVAMTPEIHVNKLAFLKQGFTMKRTAYNTANTYCQINIGRH